MKRDIEQTLLTWKTQKQRLPLLLRGARQVGKSFVVEKFGKEQFEHAITINFEQTPEACRCFDALDPKKICASLELLTRSPIIPEKTLLFLDEIQECPKAITAMRYFKEQMPNLHLIGAGSLLEFILNDIHFKMPVGRVQFMYLHPLSFGEFLEAAGYEKLRHHLKTITVAHPPENVIHDQLLRLIREYVALGGMPAALSRYLETQSLHQCQETQTALLNTYRNDFGKYAKHTQHKYLQLLFEKAPGLVAQWFKYSKVDPHIQSRDLKSALSKLCDAGLIHLIHATAASGIPLITTLNEKKFKLLFLDVGLVKRACHLDLSAIFEKDLFLVNQGALAEQFVGQELLAYTDRIELPHLFFWIREAQGSSAEVDYVVTVNSHILPVEVKSGATGKLKSLKIFMKEKHSQIGVQVSQAPLSFKEGILSLPFYLIEELPRLTKEMLAKNS